MKDERCLKPDESNPYLFIASIIKNYQMSLEK